MRAGGKKNDRQLDNTTIIRAILARLLTRGELQIAPGLFSDTYSLFYFYIPPHECQLQATNWNLVPQGTKQICVN